MEAVYGYFSADNVGTLKRRNFRYIGLTTKGNFIKAVTRIQSPHVKASTWIRDRTSITGNEDELRIANEFQGFIVKVDWLTSEVISTYPLQG
ncbi:unnamed protein product [marine sediment metagenome]|uniref:Uncharacterized protein n=1 Tax=marine sediment metagenome TaxID=412755 RepID=X0V602_9ZZZZ